MRTLCILGLGYVGLPTASLFATEGFKVTGVDTNPLVIRALSDGFVHIEEAGLKTMVKAALSSGNLAVAAKPVPSDVFIIAVPTPITADKRMDASAVRTAAESLVPILAAGNLVILESTVAPRTTTDILVPILERSGLKAGKELHVAYCPERILPGHTLKEMVQNDRVVGGVDPRAAEMARELYSHVVEGEIAVTDATSAELTKLTENTYRDVNIALANELARAANQLGCDASEVFALANRHPRVKILTPGPGVGGHCIPVDPWFLVEALPDTCRLIRTAREINDGQPAEVVRRVRQIINGQAKPKVTVLGLAYKADVDDIRDSPSVEIVHRLKDEGYEVGLYDPHVKRTQMELSCLMPALSQTDCVLLLTDHTEFKFLDPRRIAEVVRTPNVLDTRGGLDIACWRAEGFRVHRM